MKFVPILGIVLFAQVAQAQFNRFEDRFSLRTGSLLSQEWEQQFGEMGVIRGRAVTFTPETSGLAAAVVWGFYTRSTDLTADVILDPRIGQGQGAFGGLMINYTGQFLNHNAYVASYHSGSDSISLWKVQNGQSVRLRGVANVNLGPGGTIGLARDGNELIVTLNGREIASYLDFDPLPGGTAGIYSQKGLQYDNFRVFGSYGPRRTPSDL